MAVNVERTVSVGTAIAIAVLGADSFHKFLPPISDVRAASLDDTKMKADVRAGELVVGITVATVGILASSIAGNSLPLFVGGMSYLAMVGTYEYLLRARQPFA